MEHIHRCVCCDSDLLAKVQSNTSDHIALGDGERVRYVNVYQGDVKLMRCWSARPGAWAVVAPQLDGGHIHSCDCGQPVPDGAENWTAAWPDGLAGICFDVIDGGIHCTYGKEKLPIYQEEWAAWHTDGRLG